MESRFQPKDEVPEELQEAALTLAVRLQAQAAGKMSTAELEGIAAEAGVEAQFVRAALERLTNPEVTETPPVATPRQPTWESRVLLLSFATMLLSAFLWSRSLPHGVQQMVGTLAVFSSGASAFAVGRRSRDGWLAFWHQWFLVVVAIATTIVLSGLRRSVDFAEMVQPIEVAIAASIAASYGLLSVAVRYFTRTDSG
jgi:hypothetical protein